MNNIVISHLIYFGTFETGYNKGCNSNVCRGATEYEAVELSTEVFSRIRNIEKAANVFWAAPIWSLNTAKFDGQVLRAPLPDSQITPASNVQSEAQNTPTLNLLGVMASKAQEATPLNMSEAVTFGALMQKRMEKLDKSIPLHYFNNLSEPTQPKRIKQERKLESS